MSAIKDLDILIQSMQPVLNEGAYYFITLPEHSDLPLSDMIATIREREGLSVVVREELAVARGWQNGFRAAWITLNVHSDLAAVGLTAAFAGALGEVGVSCNVVAGHHHDHIFVPFEQADLAMQTLLNLQKNAFQAA